VNIHLANQTNKTSVDARCSKLRKFYHFLQSLVKMQTTQDPRSNNISFSFPKPHVLQCNLHFETLHDEATARCAAKALRAAAENAWVRVVVLVLSGPGSALRAAGNAIDHQEWIRQLKALRKRPYHASLQRKEYSIAHADLVQHLSASSPDTAIPHSSALRAPLIPASARRTPPFVSQTINMTLSLTLCASGSSVTAFCESWLRQVGISGPRMPCDLDSWAQRMRRTMKRWQSAIDSHRTRP
jgi:hypothetical protein